MAISKVWIEEGCTACGLCESTCDVVFKVEDEAVVLEGVNYIDFEQEIIEAAENCPVEVIKFE